MSSLLESLDLHPQAAPPRERLLVVGAGVFAALVYAMLPQGIIALNDDFGYLRSVVETLQRGRPWTDDWLEPWSAGFSTLSALVYLATGSFLAATHGLLAVLAGFTCFGVARMLVARGIAAPRALVVSVLGLTFPTVLWKEVQFTGMALYLPCLVGAIWAAEARRWPWFFVAWILAFSTRQSALAWAALPIAAVGLDVWRERSWRTRNWLPALVTVAVGLGAFWLIGRYMNRTVAQKMITENMWRDWHWTQAWASTRVAVVMVALAVGWAALALGNFSFGSLRASRGRQVFGVAVLAAGAWLCRAELHDYVWAEFDSVDIRAGVAACQVLIIAGALGLAFGRFRWRPVPAVAALAAIAVLSFRATLWDYYLFDAAVFGFFALARVPSPAAPGKAVRWVVGALAVSLALCHAVTLLHIKSTLDRTHVLTVLGSRAIEEGRIPPNHASFLPFGLMGWYYFPYYSQRMVPGNTDLADFGRYLEQDCVQVAWRYSKRLRVLPMHDGTLPADRSGEILTGKFNYCWLYGVEVMLIRAPVGEIRPAKEPYPAGYRPPTFPADDAAWCALISGQRKLAVP